MLEAIDGLPEDEREVFDLVRIQGLTQPEAAEVLGVSVKTVQRRLNRGLVLLAEQLADLRPDERRGRAPADVRRGRRRRWCVAEEGRAMAGDPACSQLLEEILDSGRTPEEVCRDCPELLPEVRRRWQAFRRVDEASRRRCFRPGDTPGRRRDRGRDPAAARRCPQVPGYEVQGELGRGGMGVVYRAWHLRLNRAVALKMLLAGAYARPEERERFRREAEAVAGLRHPNIVQVYDVGDVDGRPYFTMEFVEGGSLAEKIAGRSAAGRAGGRAGGDAGRRRPRGAPERHRPPRPQAGQRPAHRGRHAQGHRLRPGPAAGRRRRADAQRRCRWARRATWPPSRRGATRARSGRPRTSTPWGRSCTSC